MRKEVGAGGRFDIFLDSDEPYSKLMNGSMRLSKVTRKSNSDVIITSYSMEVPFSELLPPALPWLQLS